MKAFVLPCALALMVGLALGWLAAPDPGPSAAPASSSASVPSPAGEKQVGRVEGLPPARGVATRPAAVEGDVEVAPREEAREPVKESGELFSARLREHAEAGIREGWSRVRRDRIPPSRLTEGIDRYRRLVEDSPPSIGIQLAREQDELDAAMDAGEAFELLARLEQGQGPFPEIAADARAFERYFDPEVAAVPRDGHAHARGKGSPLEDGVTLHFPAGVFRLREREHFPPEMPRDVTLAGSGKDATLLLFGDLSPNNRLRNFQIRSCTVFMKDELFDLRREAASIRLDGVRLLGHDRGAGGSELFSAPGLVLLARDCEVVGGYGGRSGSGRVLGVSSGQLVARFERCRFVEITFGLEWLPESSTVVFSGCDFDGILDDVTAHAARKPGIRLEGCSVRPYDRNAPDAWPPPQRDLDGLFPGWRDKIR